MNSRMIVWLVVAGFMIFMLIPFPFSIWIMVMFAAGWFYQDAKEKEKEGGRYNYSNHTDSNNPNIRNTEYYFSVESLRSFDAEECISLNKGKDVGGGVFYEVFMNERLLYSGENYDECKKVFEDNKGKIKSRG